MSNLVGKVQTVTGLVTPDSLGHTLPHEHLICDAQPLGVPTDNRPENVDIPFNMENLGWIRYNPYSHLENLTLFDEETIAKEMRKFKEVGGGTIVDVTPFGIGRNVTALARLSELTGVPVVCGAGFYVGKTHPPNMNELSVQDLAEVIANEVTVGIDGTQIKAGVIGEIGCSFPILPNEKKVLQAAAIAQKRTGAPLIIHPGRNEDTPLEIMHILRDAGADTSRVVMSHLDRTIFDFNKLLTLAETGCYLEFDLFGVEVSHYQLNDKVDMPSDGQRIKTIAALVQKGLVRQIMVSHDIHTKHRLLSYGGHGYGHVVENIAPRFLKRNMTQADVDVILKENPQRWLTFV
eukprot:GILK01002364.1.p1 GENE.GILK01002364.1~~GILK01002364.1.p1  ORF type:complete len:361 (+),score=58.31 GILK01002364.1:40-1083(+)